MREFGGDLTVASVLRGSGWSSDVAMVGTREPTATARLAGAPPLSAGRRVVCGADPSVAPDGPGDGSEAPGD